MGHREHRKAAEGSAATFAVLTTTDRRTERTDESGRIAVALLEKAGHRLAGRDLVPNDAATIRAAIRRFLKAGADLVLVTGGTGAGPRDVSVQAARACVDREMEGFGELFRFLSYGEIGSAAMLSRAFLGLCGAQAVCVTPGSPKAVALALKKLVVPELAHLLGQARGR